MFETVTKSITFVIPAFQAPARVLRRAGAARFWFSDGPTALSKF